MNGRRWIGLMLILAGLALLGYGTWRLAGNGGDVTPTVTPSASASQAITSEAPSAAPTSVPPTATPVPPLGEADVRAFVEVLVTAIQAGDVDTLMADLHPATLDRYGNLACATWLAGANPTFEIEVLEVQEQTAWDYVTDGLTTTIPDAWSLAANQTQGGVTTPETLHFAPSGGAVRWFTDCGTPMPGG